MKTRRHHNINVGTMREKGFRYVYQNGNFSWVHPVEIREGAIDCTDMDDDEFELFIIEKLGLNNTNTA